MIIFMPFDDFTWSARCLDNPDLSVLRLDILRAMQSLSYGDTEWDNHPGVLMWKGHERALLAYQQAVCYEWTTERGQEDIYWDLTRSIFLYVTPDPMSMPLIPPCWMGNFDLHISHQSNLLRINEAHYRKHFPGIRTDHPYIWPSN